MLDKVIRIWSFAFYKAQVTSSPAHARQRTQKVFCSLANVGWIFDWLIAMLEWEDRYNIRRTATRLLISTQWMDIATIVKPPPETKIKPVGCRMLPKSQIASTVCFTIKSQLFAWLKNRNVGTMRKLLGLIPLFFDKFKARSRFHTSLHDIAQYQTQIAQPSSTV